VKLLDLADIPAIDSAIPSNIGWVLHCPEIEWSALEPNPTFLTAAHHFISAFPIHSLFDSLQNNTNFSKIFFPNCLIAFNNRNFFPKVSISANYFSFCPSQSF
jgi:hypothetical protein